MPKTIDPDEQFMASMAEAEDLINRAKAIMVEAVKTRVEQGMTAKVSRRIKDSKANLRMNNLHEGGHRPFGYRLGERTGNGAARELKEDPAEQKAIQDMRRLRFHGRSLMYIRDVMRKRGFKISHNVVARCVVGVDKNNPRKLAAD